MANQVRKAGLTVAVEAARDDMRKAMGKKVTDSDLMDGVRAAFQAGWQRVKLYFMAGFPGESDEDIAGIWEISRAIADQRRQLGRPPAQVTASVSWLVPKPFTPLQWMAQPRLEYFQEVRRQLGRLAAAGPRYVKLKTHDAQRSILEAVFARGDRRLGAVIHEAWKRGARFDGWNEVFDNRIWLDAYEAVGIDPDFYAHRERSFDELLPWDHIGQHMKRSFLERAYQSARKL